MLFFVAVPLAAPSVTLRSLSMTSLYVIWKELPPSVARGVVVKYKLHWRKRNHPYTDIVQVPGNITEYTLTGNNCFKLPIYMSL